MRKQHGNNFYHTNMVPKFGVLVLFFFHLGSAVPRLHSGMKSSSRFQSPHWFCLPCFCSSLYSFFPKENLCVLTLRTFSDVRCTALSTDTYFPCREVTVLHGFCNIMEGITGTVDCIAGTYTIHNNLECKDQGTTHRPCGCFPNGDGTYSRFDMGRTCPEEWSESSAVSHRSAFWI
ncbi:hypothetical protein QOT17_004631 [Balamuthia mandrillaris]